MLRYAHCTDKQGCRVDKLSQGSSNCPRLYYRRQMPFPSKFDSTSVSFRQNRAYEILRRPILGVIGSKCLANEMIGRLLLCFQTLLRNAHLYHHKALRQLSKRPRYGCNSRIYCQSKQIKLLCCCVGVIGQYKLPSALMRSHSVVVCFRWAKCP